MREGILHALAGLVGPGPLVRAASRGLTGDEVRTAALRGPRELCRVLEIEPEKARDVCIRLRESCETWRRAAGARGLREVSLGEGAYPEKLRHLRDPPLVLFCEGDPGTLRRPLVVAVVGSRKCSSYGMEVARGLGLVLAKAGIPVVSGGALGIDSAVHGTVVSAGGAPVVVLPSGLDMPYPARNRKLFEECARLGCLVTEFPLGTQARRYHFPVRNRLIAALADAVVIVEAGEKSGALITAGAACDLGRDVLAVPGRIDYASAAGSNRLLTEGAVPLVDMAYLLEYLNVEPARAGSRPEKRPDEPKVGPNARRVLEALGKGAVSVDELIAGTGLERGVVITALGELELGGLVTRESGRYVARLPELVP